jgi:hypothetical protein
MLIYCLNLILDIKMSVMTCRCVDIDDYIQGYGHIFLRYGVILIVFYGFYIKPRAFFFVRSCIRKKHKNAIEHSFITFLGSTRLYEK